MATPPKEGIFKAWTIYKEKINKLNKDLSMEMKTENSIHDLSYHTGVTNYT